jgi:C4-dicarboxylate-specific signal transduction histidine kinase
MSVFAFATRRNLTPYIPLLAYVLFACFIALAGFQGFHKIENLIEVEKLHNLGAIADLKVEQIVTWRRGHIRRAEAFSNGALLATEFEQWQQAPSGLQEQKLLRVLAGLQLTHGYATASLLDRQGKVRITTGKAGVLDDADTRLALEAMKGRQPLFSDIHGSGPGSQVVSLSLVAPLLDAKIKNGQLAGAILLQIDPYDFLYPLVQAWPSPSPSAETLLTRKEGGEVVFINELRHRKGAALSLRIPLSAASLPTVMAIHGEVSTKSGLDYRGVPVVAAMRSVPGTSWFMVSKVDKDEIFAPIHQLKQWAASLGLAFAVLGGLFFFAWLQGVHARQKQLKAEHDAALERELLLKHFEYLTRHANDMIIVLDEAGQIIEANERAQKVLGYGREEMLQKHVLALHDPLDKPTIPGKLEMLKRDGELRVEGRYQRKDGSIFPVEISARVIEVQGVRYMQGIIRDLTEHKQLEEMRAKIEHAGRLNVAGEMASSLAHELSQPLTACNNYLDVCLRRMDEELWGREKLRDTLTLASVQAERAGRIVSHLKDLVRKQGHERALVDINLVARDVMTLVEDEVRRLGISLHMTLLPLPRVMACRVEIEQVLLNLYRNAIEAMSAWPIRQLRVSTRLSEAGYVLIAVSDTGKGILLNEMANLFSPFQTTKKDGLGLGLVICRSIVENHGGQIWADANMSLGAEFCFTLPAGAEHE